MFEFVLIQPGTFMMGSPEREADRFINETQHKVTLASPFYMQTTPVTQKQWQSVTGSNPSYFKGENLPVEQVSWNDVQEFIQRLNQRNEGVYRLPTEAEWEYCCRAGNRNAFYFGNNKKELDKYMWYDQNSDAQTHPVTQKKPNAWGLYDMQGNVWEWCQDWYGDYSSKAVVNPHGSGSGEYKVLRGASWVTYARYCRSAFRFNDSPNNRASDHGFRLVKEDV